MPEPATATTANPDSRVPGAGIDTAWILGGACIWMLLFLWLPPTVFGGPDFVRYFEPYLSFLRSAVLQGEMPWWNPYASLGRPFAADLQTGTFYPTNYLSVLFGLKAGWMAATFLHGVFGIWSFIRLARWCGSTPGASLAGALVFLFSAPLLARMQVGTVNYAYSWCYLPAGLWLACRLACNPGRRVWAGLVLVWALQLLSGHPQPFWLSLAGTGVFVTLLLARPPWRATWRQAGRTVLLLLAALACTLALCGIVLVPFLELTTQSNRATPVLTYAAQLAMTPTYWMSLLTAPSAQFAVNWEYNMYIGPVAVLGGLVALSRWREPVMRAAGGMILLGAVIGLGEATPAFAILFKFLPGLSSFRIPARAAALVAFGLLVAATTLAGRDDARARRVVPVGCFLLIAFIGTFSLASMPPDATYWLAGQCLLVLLAGAGWWLELKGSNWARQGRWLLPAVMLLGLYRGIPDLSRVPFDRREFSAETMVVSAIRDRHLDRELVPVRVCLPPELMRENSGMVHGYATLTGFESLSLRRVWNYLHFAAGMDPYYGFASNPPQQIYDQAGKLDAVNLSVWLPPASSSLVINSSPDPRAYVATRITPVTHADEAVRLMIAGHPFHENALLERPVRSDLLPPGLVAGGTADVTKFTLNSLEIAVDSPGGGLLVVAEAWYPGWRARVNGAETSCTPANGWMRSVIVPAGHSIVQLNYHQNGLVSGGALSLAAMLVLGWAAFSRR